MKVSSNLPIRDNLNAGNSLKIILASAATIAAAAYGLYYFGSLQSQPNSCNIIYEYINSIPKIKLKNLMMDDFLERKLECKEFIKMMIPVQPERRNIDIDHLKNDLKNCESLDQVQSLINSYHKDDLLEKFDSKDKDLTGRYFDIKSKLEHALPKSKLSHEIQDYLYKYIDERSPLELKYNILHIVARSTNDIDYLCSLINENPQFLDQRSVDGTPLEVAALHNKNFAIGTILIYEKAKRYGINSKELENIIKHAIRFASWRTPGVETSPFSDKTFSDDVVKRKEEILSLINERYHSDIQQCRRITEKEDAV